MKFSSLFYNPEIACSQILCNVRLFDINPHDQIYIET